MTMSNEGSIGAGATAPVPVLKGISTSSSSTGKYFGRDIRIGSRKVKIIHFPKNNFLPKDPGAKQIRDEVIKKISPGWKKGTKDVNRGLTREEEIVYLPSIIGVKSEAPDWENRTKMFWFDYSISIPTNGLEIEAGFKLKPDNVNAEPIDIMGYIAYNVARTHSRVANEEDDNPAQFDFRIIDVAKKLMEEETEFEALSIAERSFYKLVEAATKTTEAKNKITYILELRGGPDFKGINTYLFTDRQKEMELKKFVNKYPSQFKAMVNDPKLETKALLRRAVTINKITFEGSTYFYNGKVIGVTEGAAVAWLDDGNNSQEKIIILSAIKDYFR